MTATPDLFDRIAEVLVALKRRAIHENRAIFAKDLAAEMRDKFPTLQEGHGKADSGQKNAISSAFGDRRHIPPTPEQVTAYSASIGFDLNGADFCDFYESKGWLVGKAKMKDWQAACRTWQRSGYNRTAAPKARDYSKL
jgi:hypothetical protein